MVGQGRDVQHVRLQIGLVLGQQLESQVQLAGRGQDGAGDDLDGAVFAVALGELPRHLDALAVSETVLGERFQGAGAGVLGVGEVGEHLAGLAEGDARAVLERLGEGAVGGERVLMS